MIKSVITEYGLPWMINRTIYSGKLKLLNTTGKAEKLFEKKVKVERIDIFDVDSESIENFVKNLSESQKNEIILQADNAIAGKIMGFSSVVLDYGYPINWHLHPLSKKEVTNQYKWYQIPDFDPDRGDIKVVWEASRFTHLFYFMRAYMLTKDEIYYKAFSNQLKDWLNKNPYPYGPHYKCGQEATLRMINILIAYSIFKSYGLVNDQDRRNVEQIVNDSYKKVQSNFFYAHKCIKNNHTLSEITGLIIGSWACNDEEKLRKAYKLMDREIRIQFLPDGGYVQFSFNYQRFALQMLEFVLKISGKTGYSLNEVSRERIKKSATLMYQLLDDTGDMPNYGSNDGALIFPVTSNNYRDFKSVINTSYTLITGRKLFNSGDHDEELLWFGNKKITESNVEGLKKKSFSFDRAGFYSIRYNDSFLMTIIQNFKTRPAQMDQNHIDLWYQGINVLCDSGTYSYASDLGKQLALTESHNTAVVDNVQQMNKRGPFFIYDWTNANEVKFEPTYYKGTMSSKNGYTHTREIKAEQGLYFINDKVIGVNEVCEFNFHTPCEIKKEKNTLLFYSNKKLIIEMKLNSNVEIVINETYRSLYYLKKELINRISFKTLPKNSIVNLKYSIKLH